MLHTAATAVDYSALQSLSLDDSQAGFAPHIPSQKNNSIVSTPSHNISHHFSHPPTTHTSRSTSLVTHLSSALSTASLPHLSSQMTCCNKPKCFNSIIIEHKNGNTLDNRRSNLEIIGYLPLGNHNAGTNCQTISAYKSLPILTRNQCDVLRHSGRTTDIDARAPEDD